ncbi:MAG: hypothetical protein AAFW82_11330, partial [Pseudomonadota bacterium]
PAPPPRPPPPRPPASPSKTPPLPGGGGALREGLEATPSKSPSFARPREKRQAMLAEWRGGYPFGEPKRAIIPWGCGIAAFAEEA